LIQNSIRFVVLALLLTVVGCGKNELHVEGPPLEKTVGDYLLVYSDRNFPAERPLEITLKKIPVTSTVQGKIVGLNMSMGTIPLFFQKNADGSWSGQFMLGACTEPVMQWRLTVDITDNQGQTVTLTDSFEVRQSN